MISAMSSGSGKTVITGGLLTLLKKRGYQVRSVKCGPDYIDPMFHSRILGVKSSNADLFLMGEEAAKRIVCGDNMRDFPALTLAEGAMGFYDGIGGTTQNSAFDIADRTDTPVLLVVRSRGQSVSLAAQVLGVLNFRRPSHICGVILNACSPTLYEHLKTILERETSLPVLGYLPVMPEAEIPSRHLGLVTADEISDLQRRFEAIAEQMERTMDVDRLLDLFADGGITGSSADRRTDSSDGGLTGSSAGRKTDATDGKKPLCRIAIARDAAFCFYYRESIEAIRNAGGQPVFFSPLHDRKLPEGVSGLYLGGGYPELYARELSENTEMIAAIRAALKEKMPVIAECGGFLYLQKRLEDEMGRTYNMVGAFAGTGRPSGHLVRFGYLHLTADADSLLFRRGESIPAHEFHHWDTDDNGTGLKAEPARGGGSFRCAYTDAHMYAGFPHICLHGEIPLAERFVEAACLHW